MAYDGVNPVSIGDPTKKSHYDQVFDNADFVYTFVADGNMPSNEVVYGNGTNPLQSSNVFEFDGTNVMIGNGAVSNNLLNIYKTDSSQAYVQFTNSDTGTGGSDGFQIGIDSNENGVLINRENTDLVFYANNAPNMRLNASGKLSMGGSTSPDLHNITIYQPDSANAYVHFCNQTTGVTGSDGFDVGIDSNEQAIFLNREATDMYFLTTSAERMRIDSGKAVTYIGNSENTNSKMTTGITLNQGAADDEILTFKSSDVNQPMTTITEADTYGFMEKVTATTGGLEIVGLDESNTVSLQLSGMTGDTASNGTIGIGGTAPVLISAFRYDSGTSVEALDPDQNAFVVRNGPSNAQFIVQADGDLYTNSSGGAGGTGAAVVKYYDNEDDIQLAEAARFIVGNVDLKDEVMEEYGERLEELGIIKNGFVCHQGIDALNLGAIGQLYNIHRGYIKIINKMGKVLKKLDPSFNMDMMDENKLLELSKTYN